MASLRDNTFTAGRGGALPDRASSTDLAYLAMDAGGVPEQFAAVLVLAAGHRLDPTVVERTVAERIGMVPRLRQRLLRTPPGCGRPIWVDDTTFDVRRHLDRLACGSPGDIPALLAAVMPVVLRPLSRERPMWRAAIVDGLADGSTALVLVLHHALADGIGGLAVLADLVDPAGEEPAPTWFPQPTPTTRELAADTTRERLRALGSIRRSWRELRSAMSAGGGLTPVRATACSLIAPTGPRRCAAVVQADLRAVRRTAHQAGGTVNAALLTAVAGALHILLRHRGESIDTFAVAVPVAGRRATTGTTLGNQVSPLLVTVRGIGPFPDRVAEVAGAVRRHRKSATGPPPIALLGPVFRPLAALGAYRWYMNHQHRLHTLVSYVHGPAAPVRFAGATVRSMIPVGVGTSGNITVAFQALSYADTLTVTAVADPDRVPDLDVLTAALAAELAAHCPCQPFDPMARADAVLSRPARPAGSSAAT